MIKSPNITEWVCLLM